MSEMITNLVPIRVDAKSTDGAVKIIETLLLDTTCLPVSGTWPKATTDAKNRTPSLSSLVDANAAYLAESILADAEVHGAVRSGKNFLGGRLDLLTDLELYKKLEDQIRTQLSIALSVDKDKLIRKKNHALNTQGENLMENVSSGVSLTSGNETKPEESVSLGDRSKSIKIEPEVMNSDHSSKIIKIKLRLRHENIAVVDEFDYDLNSSGLEGCCPVSLANSIIEELNLPTEFAPSITVSLVEQIYGVDVPHSLEGLDSEIVEKEVPAAIVLDTAKCGTSADFTQMILDCKKNQ